MKKVTKQSAQKKLNALIEEKKKLEALEKRLSVILDEETQLVELIKNYDKPKDITETVKSFEAACKYEKKDPKKVLPYPSPKTEDERYLNAVSMLNIIVRVWRQDWIPDYSNGGRYKYYPYFIYKSSGRSSGFVFGAAYYDCDGANAGSGSRHVFETREKAALAGKLFEKIYNTILTFESK